MERGISFSNPHIERASPITPLDDYTAVISLTSKFPPSLPHPSSSSRTGLGLGLSPSLFRVCACVPVCVCACVCARVRMRAREREYHVYVRVCAEYIPTPGTAAPM